MEENGLKVHTPLTGGTLKNQFGQFWQNILTFQNFFWMKNTTATLVSNQIVSTFPYDIKGYFNVAKFHTEKP